MSWATVGPSSRSYAADEAYHFSRWCRPFERGAMLTETLRDLQWRSRRFVVATIGVALVFAVTLVLSGLSESFHREARRMMDDIGADVWLVRNGVTGPFTMFSPIPAELVAKARTDLAAARVDPLVIFFSNG